MAYKLILNLDYYLLDELFVYLKYKGNIYNKAQFITIGGLIIIIKQNIYSIY